MTCRATEVASDVSGSGWPNGSPEPCPTGAPGVAAEPALPGAFSFASWAIVITGTNATATTTPRHQDNTRSRSEPHLHNTLTDSLTSSRRTRPVSENGRLTT